MTDRTTPTSRRRFLHTGAIVTAAALAGCAGGGSGGGSSGGGSSGGGDDPYAEWLDGAQGYDGSVVDRTGRETVSVSVGAGNGLAFDPVAVAISPGTTVVWEWTGRGGQHNVQADSGAFESELAVEEGFTYEQTFAESGVVRYFCLPHQAVGMKGVVDVVER
jgi:halocyanin-like protein